MQLHTLKRTHKNKKDRIVGRGGKHAKTSGRGTKGQNARAGHKKRPEMRDFIKRLPKLRGRGKNINTSIQLKPVVLNLSKINFLFKAGDEVNPKTLVAIKAVETRNGTVPTIKILGTGTIDKKINVVGCLVSATAQAAIEKAGGSVKAE